MKPDYDAMERYVTHEVDGCLYNVMVITRADLVEHRKSTPWFEVTGYDLRFTCADYMRSHFVIFIDYDAGVYKVLKDRNYPNSNYPMGFIHDDIDFTKTEHNICTCECHRDGLDVLHCMPCCDVTYEKYITADGEVDFKRWAIAKRRAYTYARSQERV